MSCYFPYFLILIRSFAYCAIKIHMSFIAYLVVEFAYDPCLHTAGFLLSSVLLPTQPFPDINQLLALIYTTQATHTHTHTRARAHTQLHLLEDGARPWRLSMSAEYSPSSTLSVCVLWLELCCAVLWSRVSFPLFLSSYASTR